MNKASKEGNLDIIKLLVKSGADINAVDRDGASSLHWGKDLFFNFINLKTPFLVKILKGVMNGRMDVVQFLVENGTNVNIKSRNGKTPIFFGTFKNVFKIKL